MAYFVRMLPSIFNTIQFDSQEAIYISTCFVSTNVEYHSPIIRMHRQHMNLFNNINSNGPNFNTFNRYATHEIKTAQIHIQY